MTVGNPTYVSVASNGSSSPAAVSPWQLVDDFRNPVNIGFSVISSSAAALSAGGAFIQVTMDDPFGYSQNPLSSPGQGPSGPSSNPFVSVFGASQAVGSGLAAGSTGSAFAAQFGWIQQPIRAWRVNNPSTAGTVIVTAIQSGPR